MSRSSGRKSKKDKEKKVVSEGLVRKMTATIGKLNDSGQVQISADAATYLSDFYQDWFTDILKKSVDNCRHEGRQTLLLRDLQHAMDQSASWWC